MSIRRLLTVVACLGVSFLVQTTAVDAETCLSPFVKRLDRPEKFLYVFCVDADAKDNDFLAVIDVDAASPKYGTILYQLDLGTAGNETHHFGFTDDRTHIWGCSLFSSRIFIIDVASDPAKPKLVKVLEDVPTKTGFAGPHSPYALPGRMLISFLASKDGGIPTGLAEFTNDGNYIRSFTLPKETPYGYDVAIKPELNRMVTSSFTHLNNYRKPLAEMDLKAFGKDLLIWDFRERKIVDKLQTGAAPLECRWSLKEKANHGFTNCALDDSIWLWEGNGAGGYTSRKLCTTGKLPADLRQSPDDRYLYVSCFVSDEIQQWDVSDLKNPRLASTIKPGEQPNMMHVTGDGKRMYITNSLLSTMDRPAPFWVRLAQIGPDGMKMDSKFNVDLNKLPTGPARARHALELTGAGMSFTLLFLLCAQPTSIGASDRLAVIRDAPDVFLTTQAGESLRLSDLKGKVLLVGFVFTTCSGTCPATTHRMCQVQDELRTLPARENDDVRLISITLDPKRDTPAVLRNYMKLYDADPAAWTFLTGEPMQAERVAADWGMWTRPLPNGQLDHPSRVFLVDRRGRIREIYDLTFLKAAWVLQDMKSLLDEK